MNKIRGNESAMPQIETKRDTSTYNGQTYVYGDVSSVGGLTIRQHFAAMAPLKIPDFFRHKQRAKNIEPLPVWYDIENKEDAELCRQWLGDGIFDLPEHLRWFSDALEKHQKESTEWDLKNEHERYFQWRTFYADALIAELNKDQ